MSFRKILPQLSGEPYLTDGGIETTLIFHDGIELPEFAAFPLLDNAHGRKVLEQYFRSYAELADRSQTGFIFESPTWRASSDWAAKLGYSDAQLANANRNAICLMSEVRNEFAQPKYPFVISGCVGPRGDGYIPSDAMSADEARSYHAEQIRAFADTEADMVTAITMNYLEEAIGVALAARDLGMPSAIAFTVETDGTLPTGRPLGEAITSVDEATGSSPAYYMINCAHPTHFESVLDPSASWTARIRGIRANASAMSHAELNESEVLDDGDPAEFGTQYRNLRERLPQLNIFGGCCGTDIRHVESVANACFA